VTAPTISVDLGQYDSEVTFVEFYLWRVRFMADIGDLFKSEVAIGLAIGVGAALLAPVIAPLVASVGKPLAKSAVKSGVLLYEKGRETAAELVEVFEDLVAEARAELQAGAAAAATAAKATTEMKHAPPPPEAPIPPAAPEAPIA
jgi:uncharacterized membrane protein